MLRCVLPQCGLQVLKALRVLGNELRFDPPLPEHDVQHAIKEHHIRARLNGQMQIRTAGGVCHPWVNDDDF